MIVRTGKNRQRNGWRYFVPKIPQWFDILALWIKLELWHKRALNVSTTFLVFRTLSEFQCNGNFLTAKFLKIALGSCYRKLTILKIAPQVKALRRQQKPVSGKLGEQRNQTIVSGREVNGLETSTQTSYQSTTSQGSYSSSTLTRSSSSSRLPVAAGKPTGLPVKSPRRKTTLEQASRSAKKKWDIIDKKVFWCSNLIADCC